MARTVQDKKLDTRTARRGLKAQREPHWKAIGQGFHIGYRKLKSEGGTWTARFRPEGKNYKYISLGKADDIQDADGMSILDFWQAQEQARKWYEQTIREEEGVSIANYTVNDAMDDYMDYLNNHGKSAKRVKYTVDTHIRPALGDILASKLTSKKISDWHKSLAEEKARTRSEKGKIAFRTAEEDAEYQRKRRNTANRIYTSLKAALNRAYSEGKIASDDAWRRVKPYRNVDTAKIDFLRINECGRLVNACDPVFRPLVQAALYTGCRYGELTRLKVQDYNEDAGTIYISESKNGKPRHIALEVQGQRFFEKHIRGKAYTDLIFIREDGETWGKSHQTRRMKDASKAAQLGRDINFHILRHTYASQLVQKGVHLAVIAAQLGHSDTRICEKHYAHLSPNYIADTIRANMPDLGIGDEEDNTVNIIR